MFGPGVKDAIEQYACPDCNVSIEELMSGIPINDGLPLDNYCMFCGTFPAISGLVYGERFDFEMEDPVLNRKISHGYSVRVLPQYL